MRPACFGLARSLPSASAFWNHRLLRPVSERMNPRRRIATGVFSGYQRGAASSQRWYHRVRFGCLCIVERIGELAPFCIQANAELHILRDLQVYVPRGLANHQESSFSSDELNMDFGFSDRSILSGDGSSASGTEVLFSCGVKTKSPTSWPGVSGRSMALHLKSDSSAALPFEKGACAFAECLRTSIEGLCACDATSRIRHSATTRCTHGVISTRTSRQKCGQEPMRPIFLAIIPFGDRYHSAEKTGCEHQNRLLSSA